MAAPAYRHFQDQNFNILFNGTTTGEKSDAAKPAKKGGLGGRRALNDISNSRKLSVPQSTKKDNLKNAIPIEKDPSAGKGKFSKASEKVKVGGRKALSDLTNSVKPFSQPLSKAGQKLDAVAENVTASVIEEGFLHNHQECIKAQMKAVDMDFFLKSVGLNNDIPLCLSATRTLQPSPKKPKRDRERLEMEEIPFGDEASQCQKSEVGGYFSPICRSPKSPKSPYMDWEDHKYSDMIVIDSP